MSTMRFDNHTVIVTNAGYGLGRAYAVFFGSRGANVVVNQCREGGFLDEGADRVVDEISRSGGVACPNYDSVLDGERIIETALERYGGIHVLINNAPFDPKLTIEEVTDESWDSYMELRLNGPYKCTRAAWPHFKAQKYGKILNTSSYAGLYGLANHVCESAGGIAQVGFTESLAKEGKKYNILANLVAPIYHEESLPQADQFASDTSDHASIVPLAALLVHVSNSTESGSIFEVHKRHIAQLRWERAHGLLLHPKLSLTAEAIMQDWPAVSNFSIPSHPDGPADFKRLFKEAQSLKGITTTKSIRFDGKVALVTGAGGGLGRQYAHFLGARGASVVVNDLSNVEVVVEEIKKMGGNAVGIQASVEDGEVLVKAAIDAYGRIDILINNAGFLRDKAFTNMTEGLWNSVIAVHLRGAYKVTKAAWPYFLKQKYGRIVNTSSTSGIYGLFGQTNYSTAKIALLGFSRTLALQGALSNIRVNAIAPAAGTPAGERSAPGLLSAAFEPSFNAPMVELLCSDFGLPHSTGEIFEVGCGWQARTRWQRSGGFTFPAETDILPETILNVWSRIANFGDGRCDYPGEFEQIAQTTQLSASENGTTADKNTNEQCLATIKDKKSADMESVEFSYSEKEVLLYNLAVGARRADQQLVFEGSIDFQALPTFGVIPMFPANIFFDLEGIVPNFSISKLLHAEHYLEILKFPIATTATLVTKPRLIEVIDRGKFAIAVTGYTTTDSTTGEAIFYNEMSGFVKGCGNFGGQSTPSNRGRASASYPPPSRVPDAIVQQKTSEEQAAFYRLTGDMTSIHVDSTASMKSGFKTPILHGLCTLGIAGQHIFREFGQFKNIKARFVGTVLPGQSLRTALWREGKFVIFQTTVIETGKLCIALAGAELMFSSTPSLSNL